MKLIMVSKNNYRTQSLNNISRNFQIICMAASVFHVYAAPKVLRPPKHPTGSFIPVAIRFEPVRTIFKADGRTDKNPQIPTLHKSVDVVDEAHQIHSSPAVIALLH